MEKLERKKIKNKDVLNRRTGGQRIVFAIMFIVLILYAISIIFPFVVVFLGSLKGRLEFATGSQFDLPKDWLFSNYIQAFKTLSLNGGETTFFHMIFNSVWYTVLSSGLTAFMSSITGYCISKYTFRGRNLIYGVAIFCMTIPVVGTMAAYYKLIGTLHLYDTPFYVVVTHLSSWGMYFLIMYGYFKNISWSYAEAVFIDGGGHFTAFFKIMLPQAVGPISTLFILSAITNWNDYTTMILYLPSYPTLASGLYEFQANALHGINYPVYYAGLLISVIPVIILFAAFSGRVMKNMSIGGIKG